MAMATEAKTNWRFYAGGMFAKGFDENEGVYWDEVQSPGDVPTSSSYGLWAGMDIQFTLGTKFFIETGLNFRDIPYMDLEKKTGTYYDGESYRYYEVADHGRRDILSIPVRVGYKLPLNEQNQFEFSMGPYVGADFDNDYYIGLSPMVTFKHRAVSFSLHWENPVFMNTSDNHFKNQFAVTVGINFNGRKPNMDNIIRGMEIANTLMGGVNSVMGQYYGGDSGSYSSSYTDSSARGGASGNYQEMYDKWTRQAQNAYNSLADRTVSTSTYNRNKKLLRDAQKEMRSWRQKAAKAGVTIQKSPLEDANVGIR